MTIDLPFESHLRSHPGDLESNLVYADYLEDQGDPASQIYRWIGEGALWNSGRTQGLAVEAMRSGHLTEFQLVLGGDEVAFIEAEHTLRRFAVWCARTLVDAHFADPSLESELNPELLAILVNNEAWLDGKRPKMVEVPDSLRFAEGWVNRVCGMAGYVFTLSAAKYTSRFAERSGVAVLGLNSQTFELTRMLARSWA